MFLDVLYPEKCMVCGKITGIYSEGVCAVCRDKLPYITGERCAICSKEISNDIGVCNDCRKKEHVFRQGFSLYAYDATLEHIIAGVKYAKRWGSLEWLTKELAYHSVMYMKRWQPQLIIPVPLNYKKLRLRGFNQAGVIAKNIAMEYNVPYENNMIVRTRNTKPQKQLSDEERAANLKDAFYLDEVVFARYKNLKRVVIVDDIYTTGSTIDMCAKKLAEAGVADIYFLTLCIGNAYS